MPRDSPKERIHGFLDGVYKLYAIQRNTIGCPVGHAAGDAEGVSATMKQKAVKFLQRTTGLIEKALRDLGEPAVITRVKASLIVNSWQGAIVVARAGGGLEHLRKVFRDLKEMVDLS